jgi:hypothetical protein
VNPAGYTHAIPTSMMLGVHQLGIVGKVAPGSRVRIGKYRALSWLCASRKAMGRDFFDLGTVGSAADERSRLTVASDGSLGEGTWFAMFSEAGFVTDGPTRPTEPSTVYRAAPAWTSGRGMSWTIERGIAQMFYGGCLSQTTAADLAPVKQKY